MSRSPWPRECVVVSIPVSDRASEVLDAAYKVVHDYPGGIDSIAQHLGRTTKYLIKAVAPGGHEKPGAKLSLEDAQKISKFTGDNRILEAMVNRFGLGISKLPPPSNASGSEVDHLIACSQGFARVMMSASLGLGSSDALVNRLGQAISIFSAFFQKIEALHGKAEISANDFSKVSAAYFTLADALLELSIANPKVSGNAQLAADMNAVVGSLRVRVPNR